MTIEYRTLIAGALFRDKFEYFQLFSRVKQKWWRFSRVSQRNKDKKVNLNQRTYQWIKVSLIFHTSWFYVWTLISQISIICIWKWFHHKYWKVMQDGRNLIKIVLKIYIPRRITKHKRKSNTDFPFLLMWTRYSFKFMMILKLLTFRISATKFKHKKKLYKIFKV